MTSSSRPHRARLMFACVMTLLAFSAVLVMSAVSPDPDARSPFSSHVGTLVVALALFLITSFVHYRIWKRLAAPLAVLSAALLIVVPLFGRSAGGATRWIDLGFINIQPTEITKLSLVLMLASLISVRRDQVNRKSRIFRPSLLLTAAYAALTMAQPDFGTAAILASIGLAMTYFSGVRIRHLCAPTALAAIAAAALILSEPYRRSRFTGFLDPITHRSGDGWQTFQSLVGLSNGGLAGTGPGLGSAKWGWLPNAPTDFIFAVAGEEFGFIGAIALISLIWTIVTTGLLTAKDSSDPFAAAVSAGISSWILIQSSVNIGGVIGLLPVTGVPLPLFSYGGTSLATTATACGILLSAMRRAPLHASPVPSQPQGPIGYSAHSSP